MTPEEETAWLKLKTRTYQARFSGANIPREMYCNLNKVVIKKEEPVTIIYPKPIESIPQKWDGIETVGNNFLKQLKKRK